jgi:hypothetical protein
MCRQCWPRWIIRSLGQFVVVGLVGKTLTLGEVVRRGSISFAESSKLLAITLRGFYDHYSSATLA